MITDYHAKYFAYELTRQRRGGDVDRLSQSLFDSSVDLNPHQIDAALFALQNPLSKGVLLADEVGLGKTIEAALVLFQYWAERKRRLVIVCPAALRKQWANELADKFQLPTQVLDSKTWKTLQKQGVYNPVDRDAISIMSFHFAARMEKQLREMPWDLVVIDEAHKLRNAHRDSNVMGQAIKRTFAGRRKVLLTATPLQNSLIELYGLSTVIDEHLFGDQHSFRQIYMRDGNNIEGLQARLKEFCKRSLRKDVLEYVRYTERKAMTVPFKPSPDEERLYLLVSAYLSRSESYGVPHRQRHLVSLVVRKLLASSTSAVIKTLETILKRLRSLEQRQKVANDWLARLIEDEDLDDDALEETEANSEEPDEELLEVDVTQLRGEIAELESYLTLASTIKSDEKSHALIKALEHGFARMTEMGSPQKAVIFTESRRTQDYLARFLEQHGYSGRTVCFSGSNSGADVTGIYQRWLKEHSGSDRITGSPAIDKRSALIDHFRTTADILIATEAASEGVNLQFCNLVVNYDLPWNPQRVEQRIGRCHRYGQQFDVVVVNFLNQINEADRRVLELLTEKFHLFDGLFGASDKVIGRIEAGVDIEQRIAQIYDTCRNPEAITKAFDDLQKDLEDIINQRMKETESKLLENFDQSIQDYLRIQKKKAEDRLDVISRLFWQLTHHILKNQAQFNNETLSFELERSPVKGALAGHYQLIRKGKKAPKHSHLYRLSHPLGEYVLDSGRRVETPVTTLYFDLSSHPFKISVLEQLPAKSGWMEVNLLELESFQREEHLVFTAISDDGALLDNEACQQMFGIQAEASASSLPAKTNALDERVRRQLEAALNRALDENDQYFKQEREKLETWADEQMKSAEWQLQDTKLKIRDAKRKSRSAQSPEEEKQHQEAIKALERQQRHQRQGIFDVEDAIEEKRDQLIDALERRMHQSSTTHHLFRVRWVLQ